MANPSWRTRRIGLNFSEVAALNPVGEGWQMYHYGAAVASLQNIVLPQPQGTVASGDTPYRCTMSENTTGLILPLLANEVRIYEREVLA